jgi:hypothetical protein
VASITATWGVEHLLVVYKLGGFDYAVDIIRIKDKTVVFTYLFSGNLKGWELKFTDPPSGAGRDYSAANKMEWYHYMQLAEQVCSMI